jgi:hypothetical protein
MAARIIILLVSAALLLCAGCKSHTPGTTESVPMAQAYLPISATACIDSTGINGKWTLVNIHRDERSFAPSTNDILIIKDCSSLEYYVNGNFEKKENFKLFRVLNYCADYQLNYVSKNDSISCINMRKDTLIFGDCSTFESTRYFYKKM